jgi:hypothetical protein
MRRALGFILDPKFGVIFGGTRDKREIHAVGWWLVAGGSSRAEFVPVEILERLFFQLVSRLLSSTSISSSFFCPAVVRFLENLSWLPVSVVSCVVLRGR